MRQKFATMDDYMASVPEDSRRILEEIRMLVRRVVPDAEETISYQMPAFKRERVFFFFAAFNKHIGIYPPLEKDKTLVKELAPYRGERGNLKFPLDRPMPYELIERVVRALAEEHAQVSDKEKMN